MKLPIRALDGHWPAIFQRRLPRFFWVDPRIILSPDADPLEYRTAMSALEVGGIYKITGSHRPPEADVLAVEHLSLSGATIADIGASDGSAALDFLRSISEFKSYVVADRNLYVKHRTYRGRSFFYDQEGNWILVVGSRTLAWPASSALVPLLYGRGAKSASAKVESQDLLLLNPEVRRLMETDPRVTAVVHDVFAPGKVRRLTSTRWPTYCVACISATI